MSGAWRDYLGLGLALALSGAALAKDDAKPASASAAASAMSASASAAASAPKAALLDINSASKKELAALPKIGDVRSAVTAAPTSATAFARRSKPA